MILTPEEEEELAEIPGKLWTKDSSDVGLLKACPPVQISEYRPRHRQHPLNPDVIEGIKPVIESKSWSFNSMS